MKNPVLSYHFSPVSDAKYSPDGNYIVTAGFDYSARLWDKKGIFLKQFSGHTLYGVYTSQFTKDGKYIVTGGLDNTVRIWDLNGSQVKSFLFKNSIWIINFSFDNNFLIALSSFVQQFEGLLSFKGKLLPIDGIRYAYFAPNGNYLVASSAADTTINIYKITNYTDNDSLVLLYKEHTPTIAYRLIFSPDGNRIMAAMNDNKVGFWDASEYHKGKIKIIGYQDAHKADITFLDVTGNSKYFISTSFDQKAILWNVDGYKVTTLSGHNNKIWSADFSPDNKLIATASDDFTVRLWDLQGNQLQVYPGHSNAILKVNFSPDGKYLLSACTDRTAHIIPVDVKMILDKINKEKICGDVWELSDEDKKLYGIER